MRKTNEWIDAVVEAGEPPHGTQSIRRAFLVLRVVSSSRDAGLGLNDIATATGLARPTAHRLLCALIGEGAVEQHPRTQRYIASRFLDISSLRPAASPLLSAAGPYLDQTAEEIGDTLFFTLRAGLETLCVARRFGSYPIQVHVLSVGVRRPLGFSASGIALLASMAERRARDILSKNRAHLRAHGETIDSAFAAVRKARRSGFAFRERGLVVGTRAVSVAFGKGSGEALATLTVAAVARRLPLPRVKSVVARLERCAADIQASLES
ncbi:MAG: helix-turn-helix domain-containing protein [Proteobacteria bacterium]|nr:helix-turn-helix domain-containing protein [Pseudomonadota bacterium]